MPGRPKTSLPSVRSLSSADLVVAADAAHQPRHLRNVRLLPLDAAPVRKPPARGKDSAMATPYAREDLLAHVRIGPRARHHRPTARQGSRQGGLEGGRIPPPHGRRLLKKAGAGTVDGR